MTIYLVNRFILIIVLFFKHWYADSFYAIYGLLLKFIRRTERKLAVRVNIHYLFKPLYQERNIIGYTIGFLFRSLIIIFGGGLYLLLFIVFIFIYIVWAVIPVFLLLKSFYAR